MKLSFTGVGSAIRFWTFDSGPMWWTCLKSVGPEISFDLAFGSFIWLFRLERDFSWLPLLYTNFFFPNFTKFRLYFRVNITYPRDPRFESDQKQTFLLTHSLDPNRSFVSVNEFRSYLVTEIKTDFQYHLIINSRNHFYQLEHYSLLKLFESIHLK